MVDYLLAKQKTKDNPMKKFNTLIYSIGVCAILFIFMAANSYTPKYTPYEILVWELKANEGYRSWWYKDGAGHSIGFGWNDCGGVRRKEIAQYTKDGKVTYAEATTITIKELEKYGKLNNDPWKNLALKLYSYNCGPTKAGSRLGKCCGGKWLCGNRSPNIRKSHTRRRKFELALWKHDVDYVYRETEKNKNKIITKIIPR